MSDEETRSRAPVLDALRDLQNYEAAGRRPNDFDRLVAEMNDRLGCAMAIAPKTCDDLCPCGRPDFKTRRGRVGAYLTQRYEWFHYSAARAWVRAQWELADRIRETVLRPAFQRQWEDLVREAVATGKLP